MTKPPSFPDARSAALFCDFRDEAFISEALARLAPAGAAHVITDDPGGLPALGSGPRIPLAGLGFELLPADGDEVLSRLMPRLSGQPAPSCIAIDMRWGLVASHGATAYEAWGELARRLADRLRAPVVSLYNKEQMIEEQAQAAFRAHRHFLAPSGLYENPFWVPAEMRRDATLDEQLAFMLGRVVPDYAGGAFFRDAERQAARGAAPDWLAPSRRALAPGAGASRWHIHCLGRLTVYTGAGAPVDWQVPGSAPNKTRTLFAYLLHNGEKGVHSDRIGELLWPEGGSEKTKRARLHHTVAMLRKALDSQHAVLRSGD